MGNIYDNRQFDLPSTERCGTLVTAEFAGQMAPVMEISDLGVQLGDRQIIDNVSLRLEKNKILAIIGPSGCGKTTFISTLNRMIDHTLPQAKVTGTVCLNGESIYSCELEISELRKKIGMVFQRPNPFPFSINKNMEFALKACGDHQTSGYRRKIEQVLSSVNLWNSLKDRLDDSATRLSGGEQQRLCIARALLSNPDVLLFDEPCSSLDPISSAHIEELIASLKTQCSIIIVTHNLAQAKRISDRCALFWHRDDSGCLVEEGNTRKLMSKPEQEITRLYVSGQLS